ncbi:pilin [Luteibacter aegosomatissinici]|uniref:pilin n=1 Tax=Luteibacter aegosomatissinici TaxID=2911539 RepID=UPI001FF825D1|nr:pilin [Luteibacter aegosomatissinici]UPG94003.1 pilin [Luteibacter aegosomatissinici]
MDDKIWIGRGGQKYGPYEEAVLRGWVKEGKVEPDVLAWRTGMAEWVPLATLLPGMEVPPPIPPPSAGWAPRGFSAREDGGFAPDPRATFQTPPSLHWFVVLLLTMVTGGIFGWIWMFVQASWVGKIDKRSKALVLFILALVSYVVGFSLTTQKTPAATLAGVLIMFGAIIVIYVGIFAMADSIKRDAAKRGLALHIGGITLFFLSMYYLQGIMTWLARWKETGQTEPGPPKAAVWCVMILPLVSILAAIAIPAYQNYIIRTEVAQAVAVAEPARTAVLNYYNSHGQMPHDNTQAGISEAASLQGRYVSGVTIDDGRITIALGGVAHRQIASGSLVLTPVVAQGEVRFNCVANSISVQYLPQTCR